MITTIVNIQQNTRADAIIFEEQIRNK